MAYTRINWVERVRQFANRFILSATGGANEYDLTRVEGNVTQAGTPLSITNLNNMDLALYLSHNTFTTAGSANAYTLVINGIASLSDLLGIPLKLKANFANTGACTLNVNGYGAQAIRQDVNVAMNSGDILSGQIIIVVWDGTYFQFMGEAAGTVTTSRTQTLSNKTLTAPKFAASGYIADANGNELVKFPATVASAVNEITVSNSATGVSPSLSASGGDTNININMVPKGTGRLQENGTNLVTTGASNQAFNLMKALGLQVDTRSWVATSWNTDNKPTHIDIKDGSTVLVTLDFTWTSGKLTQVVASGGGKTVTYTITWSGDNFTGWTKVVV